MQNLFRFYFCVPFSSIKSYNNSCKVFSRSEQETGKRKHKEPPSIREAKKFHSLHRFRYNSSPSELARVTVSRPYRRPSGAGGDIKTNYITNFVEICIMKFGKCNLKLAKVKNNQKDVLIGS